MINNQVVNYAANQSVLICCLFFDNICFIGMPHNQLGTLKQNQTFLCESSYHYMRW